jgi:enterochelin esterase-like enzyme
VILTSILATDPIEVSLLLVPVLVGWLRLFSSRDERVVEYNRFRSKVMGKNFKIEVWLPPGRTKGHCNDCQILISNDGQDLRAMQLRQTLDSMVTNREIPPIIVVGVWAGTRMQDYGVTGQTDYLRRGGLATTYGRFIAKELVPYIQKEYNTLQGADHTAIMGFSLGGLSALDIAWHWAGVFSRVGVFSGSFWWRSKGYLDGYNDSTDRIMQATIRSGAKPANPLRFWLQTGTEDETNDRDSDGIIDAIDDTREVMFELAEKGYEPEKDFTYCEVEGGHHNQQTWGAVLPQFLKWAFGTPSDAGGPTTPEIIHND